jgi:hypothetical protein
MSAAARVLDPQTIANRENSLHSTGPITAEGKAKSSMNSFRHGLTSKQIVLPGEDAEQYDAFREEHIEIYKPANVAEQVLVEEVCAASWRLMRARGQETAILQKLLGDKAGLHAEFATLFVEKPKEVARLLRYITTIERAYYRAAAKLEKMQQERKKQEQADAAREAFVQSVRERQQQNGFVSQNGPVQFQTVPPAAQTESNASVQRRR